MQPIDGPAVWRAADIERRLRDGALGWRLEPEERAELEAAAAGSAAADATQHLARRARQIRNELEEGIGMVRLAGLDAAAHDEAALERMLLALAGQVGTPVPQTTDGARIFRVADAGLSADDARARGPNSRAALTFHSDRCDVIGFLCLRQASRGGENIVVSAGAIHNEIGRRRPDLLPVLYEPFYWKRHNIDTGNRRPWYRMPIFAREGGRFAVTLMQVLIDRAHRMPELPDLTPEPSQALALVQSLAAEPEFQYRFLQSPGELLLLNNYVTLHSRTAFTDEPGTPGRLLLRVWISVPDSRPLPASWEAHYGAVAPGALRGGLKP